YAYVVNSGNNTVSVIDTATNMLASAITGLGANPYGIALSPTSNTAYVTNEGDGTVSVIDTSTGRVIGDTITVGTNPTAIAISHDGKRLYVANTGTSADDLATVTDPDTGETIDIPTGGVAGSVSVIDTASNKILSSVTTTSSPNSLLVSPD